MQRSPKQKWKSLEVTGLPPTGMYLFKDEETDEVRRVLVRQQINGSKTWFSPTSENFKNATHWAEYEAGHDDNDKQAM